MKILLIGSGGREHAMAWSIAASPLVRKFYCAPGNPGISNYAECVSIKITDYKKIVNFALKKNIDLVVVGPETPLVDGLVDLLEEKNIKVFGPSANAAQLEGSKIFSREICHRHNIPQPKFKIFKDPSLAIKYIKSFENNRNGFVIKADGLAAGKGVILTNNHNESINAIETMLVKKEFGTAGSKIIIEEKLEGIEASIFALSDGKTAYLLSTAQDYKRAFENDLGPNTGGMGAISPAPSIDKLLSDKIINDIIQPIISGMANEGNIYKGILYCGIMLTKNGPQVIEFNARFGDPEAQAILPRLKSDLVTAFLTTIEGGLNHFDLRWHDKTAITVVMASKGYPNKYNKNFPITGISEVEKNGCLVFQASTKENDDKILITDGGRVLSITSIGKDIKEAQKNVYNNIRKINFKSAFYRNDIGSFNI